MTERLSKKGPQGLVERLIELRKRLNYHGSQSGGSAIPSVETAGLLLNPNENPLSPEQQTIINTLNTIYAEKLTTAVEALTDRSSTEPETKSKVGENKDTIPKKFIDQVFEANRISITNNYGPNSKSKSNPWDMMIAIPGNIPGYSDFKLIQGYLDQNHFPDAIPSKIISYKEYEKKVQELKGKAKERLIDYLNSLKTQSAAGIFKSKYDEVKDVYTIEPKNLIHTSYRLDQNGVTFESTSGNRIPGWTPRSENKTQEKKSSTSYIIKENHPPLIENFLMHNMDFDFDESVVKKLIKNTEYLNTSSILVVSLRGVESTGYIGNLAGPGMTKEKVLKTLTDIGQEQLDFINSLPLTKEQRDEIFAAYKGGMFSAVTLAVLDIVQHRIIDSLLRNYRNKSEYAKHLRTRDGDELHKMYQLLKSEKPEIENVNEDSVIYSGTPSIHYIPIFREGKLVDLKQVMVLLNLNKVRIIKPEKFEEYNDNKQKTEKPHFQYDLILGKTDDIVGLQQYDAQGNPIIFEYKEVQPIGNVIESTEKFETDKQNKANNWTTVEEVIEAITPDIFLRANIEKFNLEPNSPLGLIFYAGQVSGPLIHELAKVIREKNGLLDNENNLIKLIEHPEVAQEQVIEYITKIRREIQTEEEMADDAERALGYKTN